MDPTGAFSRPALVRNSTLIGQSQSAAPGTPKGPLHRLSAFMSESPRLSSSFSRPDSGLRSSGSLVYSSISSAGDEISASFTAVPLSLDPGSCQVVPGYFNLAAVPSSSSSSAPAVSLSPRQASVGPRSSSSESRRGFPNVKRLSLSPDLEPAVLALAILQGDVGGIETSFRTPHLTRLVLIEIQRQFSEERPGSEKEEQKEEEEEPEVSARRQQLQHALAYAEYCSKHYGGLGDRRGGPEVLTQLAALLGCLQPQASAEAGGEWRLKWLTAMVRQKIETGLPYQKVAEQAAAVLDRVRARDLVKWCRGEFVEVIRQLPEGLFLSVKPRQWLAQVARKAEAITNFMMLGAVYGDSVPAKKRRVKLLYRVMNRALKDRDYQTYQCVRSGPILRVMQHLIDRGNLKAVELNYVSSIDEFRNALQSGKKPTPIPVVCKLLQGTVRREENLQVAELAKSGGEKVDDEHIADREKKLAQVQADNDALLSQLQERLGAEARPEHTELHEEFQQVLQRTPVPADETALAEEMGGYGWQQTDSFKNAPKSHRK